MSLEATMESLRHALAGLQETVSALQVTVAEDKPAHGGAVLVDQLENLVTDLSSTIEEADDRAARALQSNLTHGPLDAARAALREIHTLLNHFTALYAGELAAHDTLARLLAMGRERGREWRAWSDVVKTAIERCRAPLRLAAGALVECWSELAGRLARQSVSVQATNIGQQITMREDQLELAGKAT